MNKKEHINNTILDFDTTLNILFDEYELDISLPIEKCLSNESIKDIIPTEENTIFDKLDSVYYKGIKDLFRTLKKVDRLGAPKFHYYKDNTIKVTSSFSTFAVIRIFPLPARASSPCCTAFSTIGCNVSFSICISINSGGSSI